MPLSSAIRSALRAMQRHGSTTALAILTLALGIGAATAMFSAVNGILLRPLPYADAEKIVLISSRTGPDGADQMSWANYEDLRDGARTLQTAAGYSRSGRFVYPGGEPELIYGLSATHELFDVLGVEPAVGRRFTAEDDREGAPDVMLISWEWWHSRLGGDPAVIGRPIQISSTGSTGLIIGVMPRGFRFPYDEREAHFYMPLRGRLTEAERTMRAMVWMDVVARLAPGASVAAANAELKTISSRLESEYLAANRDLVFAAYPLYDEIFGDVQRSLWILFAAVGAVLLIGCANVANLLLARASMRSREIAVRSALGASRLQIVKQLLIESVGLGLIAGVLGIALGAVGLRLLVAIAPPDIPRLDQVSLDWRVLLFAAAVSIASGLIFGLAPAFFAARTGTSQALRESTRGTTGGRGQGRLREAFVVAEIALSLLLLPAAGLLLRSYWNLTAIDPGYDDSSVSIVDLSFLGRHETDEQILSAFRQLTGEIETIPGVQSTGSSQMLPHQQEDSIQDFTVVGRPEPEPGMTPVAPFNVVSPGFFETLRIPVLSGRTFSDRDSGNAPAVAIINEAFAGSYFPDGDPIGQRIDSGGVREIVGIVGNVRSENPSSEPAPALYVPLAQDTNRRVRIYVRSAPGRGPLTSELRATVKRFDPAQPVIDIRTLASYRTEALAARRLSLWLLMGLAALAFGLAAVGIYSVMSFMVSQRRSEIGVRMAFGAEPRDIRRLVLGRVGLLVAVGGFLGIAAALAGARLIAGFLFGLTASDPVTFVAILLILGAIGLLAGWFPARRASRLDPLSAIRND